MKKKYIAPYSKEIKLDELMDDGFGETLPSASYGENHTVDAKPMGLGNKKPRKPAPDNGYDDLWDDDQWHTNLWDDMMWK